MAFASLQDLRKIEQEADWESRDLPRTMYEFTSRVATRHGDRNAISFQLLSAPTAKAETLSWRQFHERSVQAANLFRSLGVGEGDVVAYLLPICNEAAVTLIGGAMAGIANPINPLLMPEQIAAILRETGAKVLVTLRAFPKTDLPEKAAEAARLAPNVQTVLEVDLNRYLTPPKSWIVPLVRPKHKVEHKAQVMDFNRELDRQNTTLDFEDPPVDRVGAYFHTGGTTGMPKVAQHRISGMVYNGWLGQQLLFSEDDTIICPLPLFHVFACHVILMAMIASGAHVVFPTPQGYRGDGVFDNFWKLIERWKVTFIITVPTAISALMQRPVDADVSSVKTAFSGSSPLPVELFHRFEKASGVTIVEGYGLTEATCLVSCNPPGGTKKIGSVGLPLPYTRVRILARDNGGWRDCGADEVGEICVANPGVFSGNTYTDPSKNKDLFVDGDYLRTGDLGRIDSDGYLYITGRAKDLIIRGGHNIDPADIEEALSGHDAVAFAGAIGQPDAFAGELPCVYVELVAGADVTEEELMEFANGRIHERAAHPKYLEILDELPKTAVGKVFKPDLRRRAITRVFDATLEREGLDARVAQVVEDPKRGLVAEIEGPDAGDEARMTAVLGEFTVPWRKAG
ncbi:acyl-CoA synthetase [Brevirhabdus pacifica]|uniref:Acyl-CoA synthetase n=1 Tax=Brevirhabdus pacifica TaxID=1267768 RepID=A0A1U7DK28_9RHOB|nr:acyl-CoA synthetase [Brevirhabdus pacifica]APX90340.1 acyl-CoA synthetase [Brevirhabdus pacifica]OWU78622.1 AMP-binding protein [Loktanella sp. 22II-4b]PJJ80793.1 fatty-acyl-CoA synthase [Brevirhabdus pacifica]